MKLFGLREFCRWVFSDSKLPRIRLCRWEARVLWDGSCVYQHQSRSHLCHRNRGGWKLESCTRKGKSLSLLDQSMVTTVLFSYALFLYDPLRSLNSSANWNQMALRHLSLLNDWNSGRGSPPPSIGTSLVGRLDLSRVGLSGHSRAGEGVRAAVSQYYQSNSIWKSLMPSLRVLGIFELAGSDGQSRSVYDAQGIAWVGLIAGVLCCWYLANDEEHGQEDWISLFSLIYSLSKRVPKCNLSHSSLYRQVVMEMILNFVTFILLIGWTSISMRIRLRSR